MQTPSNVDTRIRVLEHLGALASPRNALIRMICSYDSERAIRARTNPNVAARIHRSTRSVRSAVRQTFSARKAAKSGDSGGGSSDSDGRPSACTPSLPQHPRHNLPFSPFLFGGAAK